MKEKLLVVAVWLIVSGLAVVPGYAEGGKDARFRHADRNDDGTVDNKEMRMEKQWEERLDANDNGVIEAKEKRMAWRYGDSKVDTDLEKKYDANADGLLQPAEVSQMLKDRAELIKTGGRALVDSAIEKEFDADGDGILDETEAKAMLEAAQ